VHGAVFAIMVQGLLTTGAIAVQGYETGRKYIPVQNFDKWALAQCRGTILVEASFESRYRMLLAGSGAYPGTTILKICLRSRIEMQKP